MNIRSILAAIAMASAGTFAALPSTMLFQGSITVDGAAKSGSTALVVALYDAATAGTKVWEESFASVTLVNGAFAVQLGGTKALPAFDKPLFVQLTADGKAAATRAPLTLAPYAAMAGAIPNVRSVDDHIYLDAPYVSVGDSGQIRAINGNGQGNLSTTIDMVTNSGEATLALRAADKSGDTLLQSTVSIHRNKIYMQAMRGPKLGLDHYSFLSMDPQKIWLSGDSVVVDPNTRFVSPMIRLTKNALSNANLTPACSAEYEGMILYSFTSSNVGSFVGCLNTGSGYAWKTLNN